MMRTMKVSLVPLASLVLLLACNKGAGDGGGDNGGDYCETCNMDDQLARIAVEGAMDCGEVGVDEDPTDVAACIEDRLVDGQPFVARQELQGIDSSVIIGFAVDASGVVQRLSYDSNICGGAACEGGCGPRVSAAVCGNPRRGMMPEDAIVDCEIGEFSTLCEPPQ